MKVSTNKKRLILSLVVFILLILLIHINHNSYKIDNKFNYLLLTISILICIVSCTLFAIKVETNNKIKLITSIIFLLLSVVLSYIIIELLNQNNLFNLYIKRLIFNFIVIILLHLFIYSLSNKISITIIVSNAIIFILGLVNYTVTCFRGTPLVPWDILSIKTAVHVATSYSFEFNYYLLLAILLFILVVSIGLKANYKFKRKKINLVLRFSFIIIIALIAILFYKTDFIDSFDFENNLWKPKDEYANNGFLASFIKQSKNLFNDKPNNYSAAAVNNILLEVKDQFPESKEPTNFSQTQLQPSDAPNIIVIMNESYSDLSVNGNFNTSKEYMSYFKSLNENTIRGYAYVSVFGGQTPNSEWEFLTNNSMAFMPYRTIPYQQYIRYSSYSLATTLKSQGYTAIAIHPWYGSGYRRNAIYPLLGFDSFDSLETLNKLDFLRKYPTDLSTYKHVIDQFENKNEDKKIFVFTVTMQNHSGYDLEGYDSTIFLEDIENCPRVEQYLSVLKESDIALEYLINYFENYNEKTVILFFGDHQPPYLEDKFWNTITKNSYNETSKYITPFILWANYDIEEKQIDKISLNYLSILLLETTGLRTTPYMNFLNTIRQEIPVITGNGYIDSKGNYYTFEYDNEYSNMLNKYQLVQYNNVFDKKNRINDFFEVK